MDYFKMKRLKLIFLLLLYLIITGLVSAKKENGKFTIIGLPDTQYYTAHIKGGSNETFKAQTDWIVANKDALNIVHVCHFGDCVQNGDNGGNDIQWRRADTAMSIIEDPVTTNLTEGISYSMNVGNHDQSPNNNPDGTTTFFNQYFGINRFAKKSYWGGNYGTNADNSYQLFSSDEYDFIVISLEFDATPNQDILNWAEGLLQTYSNRNAIIISHYLLDIYGNFGPQGQAIYEKLKYHSNLFLMLCGHMSWEAARSDTFNGHIVHTLLADYQERPNGGDGWMRLMTFDPDNNTIEVKTYSPTLNQYETDINSEFMLSGIELIKSTSTNTINISTNMQPKIKIYAYPTEQNITVDLSLDKDSKVQIDIIDVTGKQLQLKKQKLLNAGNHKIFLETNNLGLSSGIYWLQININNHISTFKLILN